MVRFMSDIKELEVIDNKNGFCGENVVFKTIKVDKENKKVAILGFEKQKKQQMCASLYILLPNEELINACQCFVEDTDIIYNNERLAKCIKNFGYKENERFDTCYDLCKFVNIEDNVYLCFHRWLGDEENKPTMASYVDMFANTYNNVVSVILDIFHTYSLKQLDKKKIECFDEMLKLKKYSFFDTPLIIQDFENYLQATNEIEKSLKDMYYDDGGFLEKINKALNKFKINNECNDKEEISFKVRCDKSWWYKEIPSYSIDINILKHFISFETIGFDIFLRQHSVEVIEKGNPMPITESQIQKSKDEYTKYSKLLEELKKRLKEEGFCFVA